MQGGVGSVTWEGESTEILKAHFGSLHAASSFLQNHSLEIEPMLVLTIAFPQIWDYKLNSRMDFNELPISPSTLFVRHVALMLLAATPSAVAC